MNHRDPRNESHGTCVLSFSTTGGRCYCFAAASPNDSMPGGTSVGTGKRGAPQDEILRGCLRRPLPATWANSRQSRPKAGGGGRRTQPSSTNSRTQNMEGEPLLRQHAVALISKVVDSHRPNISASGSAHTRRAVHGIGAVSAPSAKNTAPGCFALSAPAGPIPGVFFRIRHCRR